MKIRGVSMAVVLAVVCTACTARESMDRATKAVADFRTSYFEGKFDEMYARAAPEFRQQTTIGDWQKLMRIMRSRLGQVRSQSDPAWNVNATTAGTFVTQLYQTEFEKGKATEQFIWKLDGKSAALVAYRINSLALFGE